MKGKEMREKYDAACKKVSNLVIKEEEMEKNFLLRNNRREKHLADITNNDEFDNLSRQFGRESKCFYEELDKARHEKKVLEDKMISSAISCLTRKKQEEIRNSLKVAAYRTTLLKHIISHC